MERYAIGIDVHKKFLNAHMVFGEYREMNKDVDRFIDSFNKEFRRFPPRAPEYIRMARYLGNRDCYILIENSTNSHDLFHSFVGLGLKVIVGHATDLKLITKSHIKNDRIDAVKLATYMRKRLHGEMEFSESYIPSIEWMNKKESCRYVAEDRLIVSNTKKQIRSHLAIIGNRDYDDHSDILAKKVREQLKGLNDPCLDHLLSKAESTMNRIESDTDRLWKDLGAYSMTRIIFSLPGAGKLTACYLTTLIIDITRFSTYKQFVAFFGIVPKVRDTGDSFPECGITHRGDPIARRLIYQMTFIHIRHEEDGKIAAKYRRLRNAGKSHNETMIACCNSLLKMLYVMLTEDREFVSDPKILEESRAEAETIKESEEEMDEIE